MNRCYRTAASLILSMGLAVPVFATVLSAPNLPPVASQPASQAASPAEAAYGIGLRAFAKGDYAAAEKAFQQALAQQRNFVPAQLGLAEIAFLQGQTDKAGKQLEQIAKAAPKDAHAQASWGRYLAVNKRYADAEGALKRAIALDATLVRPRMDLADLYATALSQPEKAVPLYQEVLAITPEHAGANYAHGVALAKTGNLAKARASLEKAARLEANNPLPSMALAQVAARQNNLDEAFRWVNQALKIQPKLAGAMELRGDLNLARGNGKLALQDYQAAVKAAPGLASAHFKLGAAQQNQKLDREAMQSYKQAIKADPGLAPAYNNLAWLAVTSGQDSGQAEAWARQAVKLAPNSAPFLDTLGWVLRAKGQLAEAEKNLRESWRLSRQPDTAYHLGVVLKDMGKSADAERAFRDALAIAPQHAGAKSALAASKR